MGYVVSCYNKEKKAFSLQESKLPIYEERHMKGKGHELAKLIADYLKVQLHLSENPIEIKTFSLAKGYFEEDSIILILETLRDNQTIHTINLSYNKITDAGYRDSITPILNSMQALEYTNSSYNSEEPHGFASLYQAIPWKW